jgi:hypothetical protein
MKTHLTTTKSTSKASSSAETVFDFKVTTDKQSGQNSTATDQQQKSPAPTTTHQVFEFVDSEDYYDDAEQKQQQLSKTGDKEAKKLLEKDQETVKIYDTPCFMANLNKRCNFFRNLNFSYILSTDYRVGRKSNYAPKSGKAKKIDHRDVMSGYEVLPLIDNSYINLNVEFNAKLDTKVSIYFFIYSLFIIDIVK